MKTIEDCGLEFAGMVTSYTARPIRVIAPSGDVFYIRDEEVSFEPGTPLFRDPEGSYTDYREDAPCPECDTILMKGDCGFICPVCKICVEIGSIDKDMEEKMFDGRDIL